MYMKKLFIFSCVLFFVCSCKKQYNCYCKTVVNYPNGSQSTSSTQSKAISTKMKKKQAQAVCDQEAISINSTLVNFYSSNGTYNPPLHSDATTKCTLS